MPRLVTALFRHCLLALLALTAIGDAAFAQQMWEPAGPVTTSAGMTAVASDPDNPKVVWVASATSVWVSDDEGQTFHLVLQLSRAAGLVRETGSQPIDPDDEDDEDDEDELTEEELDALPLLDVDTEHDRPVREGDDEVADEDEDDAVEQRFGVVRMRVLGDRLFVCTSRGLFTVARDARRMGTGRELRLGRKVAVNDAAFTPDGRLWVATDLGLLTIAEDGLARPARGLEEDLVVRAVVVAEGRLVLATSRGLRFGSRTLDGFDRFALGGREDAGAEDILVEPEGRILVAGGDQVARIAARPGEQPLVEDLAQVPGAARLAFGREGARWVVGARGAWRWTRDDGWQRHSDGLFDRRLLDVAPGLGPLARLWVAGRAGAWRLVPESSGAFSAAAERLAEVALEGYPSDDKVLDWAVKARGMQLDQIDGWATDERLSWLLPKVELRFRANRQRDEDYLFIPILERRLLDQVDVRPKGDEVLVMAWWDVMPAMLAALDGSKSVFESSRVRARKQLERVREVVMPLYQTWAKKKIDLATSEGGKLAEVVKELLALERLEADLHVYTGGRFPVGPKGSRRASAR